MPLVRSQGLALLTEAILTNPANYEHKLGEAVSVQVLSQKTLPILINKIIFMTKPPPTTSSPTSEGMPHFHTSDTLDGAKYNNIIPKSQRWQLALSIMNSKVVKNGRYRLDEALWNTVLSSCPCDNSKRHCLSALDTLFLKGRGSITKKGTMDTSCLKGSSAPSNR